MKVLKIKERKKPIISVIVPTYQEEKYIEPTLVAISNQTLKRSKYEIIISDANSKDRTIKIAKKYADKIIITNKKGIAIGRNLGAKYAKGKYLVFIDADTIILPQTLEEIIKEFNDCNCIISRALPINSSIFFLFIYFFYNLFLSIFSLLNFYQAGGYFIAVERTIFRKIGGFNENLETCEDLDFLNRVSKIGKVKLINLPVITSTRRFEKEGKIKLTLKYILFFLLFHLFGISAKNYKPIR
jgi:glycosyltransferase involved in cell wall biosynthesis